MNSTINLLKNHRSNRHYENDYKINKEELEEIILAAKQAPSWMNGQHYKIIVVDNQKLKEKIYNLSTKNEHIKTSSVFLIFCIDLTRQKIASEMYNKNFAIDGNIDILINATTDATLAMQNAAIAAESLGYGTVFCGGVRYISKELIEIFNIPKYSFPICGLSIGKLDEKLTTEKVKPRFSVSSSVGFNNYINSTTYDIKLYDNIMENFAEARETKLWSKKFADAYEKNEEITLDILRQQGF